MKKIIIKFSYILLAIQVLVSCEDVIDLDVPNAGTRLVVEASINWEKGTSGKVQTIKLSSSTGYFETKQNVPVTGAIVEVVKENDGKKFVFVDKNNGLYSTESFIPELGASYVLNISYNGSKYRAKESMIGFTKINKVIQEEGFEEDKYRLRVLFEDPGNQTNFYLAEFSQDNLKIPSLKSVSDEFVNGNEIFALHMNDKNVKGAKVDVKIYGISERFYYYIEQLTEQAEQGGGPFQTIPAQLKGNCKNVDKPNEEVLGYFRLSQFEKTSYIIE